MTRRVGVVAALLLAAVCVVAAAGCAGTRTQTGDIPSSPEVIREELRNIAVDIANTEEMYKAKLTELQMEETADSRSEVTHLWIDLEHLRSRKAALEEALEKLEHQDTGR
jgi:hypothetical protein